MIQYLANRQVCIVSRPEVSVATNERVLLDQASQPACAAKSATTVPRSALSHTTTRIALPRNHDEQSITAFGMGPQITTTSGR